MQLVGTLLIVLGAAVAWLLGKEGLSPDEAIAHVKASLHLPSSP